MIIVHMLHERLDLDTIKQWELQRETETPTVKQMLDFLDRHAAALVNVADLRNTRPRYGKAVYNNERSTGSKREHIRKVKTRTKADC